ncbi:LANO_0A03752g1_1 [Lachancea nothofagi CBS 11611]|uniref:LANO_0A03752g1_1 n=1 Tax=Lachancea nothofagi CBS 11611 TaxID=1266666 RepID=A0A1G4IPP3_9SACH|nr:LANO_0A03752g1_1 [Lachancea nothofagi CBS 11611]
MLLRLLVQRAAKLVITLASIVIFLQGSIAIVTHQLIAKLIFNDDPVRRQKHLDSSKKTFILLLVTILTIVAPSKVRITTDNHTIAKNLVVCDPKTGRLLSSLKRKSVMISNHQIYTDWVFLWWLAYTAGLGGNVFIMLKKSLQRIPIMGYGMKNFKFIFMNRKWSRDKINLANRLSDMDHNARGVGELAGKRIAHKTADGLEIWNDKGSTEVDHKQICWPYSLLIFPEGTNLSQNTRNKSEIFASKSNLPIFRNLVLPRVTGLRFALQELKNSCEVVYDATIGYSGVKQHEYGQDIYKIGNIFLKGHSPDVVDIHLRAFDVHDIPIDDESKFTEWLLNIWREKDELLDRYYATGSFDSDGSMKQVVTGTCKIQGYEMARILALPCLTILILAIMIWSKYA